jgi:ABC-2 type transport system ATP-binding protein
MIASYHTEEIMKEAIISVRHFTKTYGSQTAVDDLTFSVEKGEIFGLLGPNGSGKTSTLESLEGIRKADGGELMVLGMDPGRNQQKLMARVGIQLQTSALPGSMTVSEAMRFFCSYHHAEPRMDLIERLNLAEKKNAQYASLSIGQQRRLALALAIAHNPELVFLDEPTAGLDVASRVELHNLMFELKGEGTTLILATHDMAEAEKMTDRVAILLKGKLAALGTPQEITAAGNGYTRVSVRTENNILAQNHVVFPGVKTHQQLEGYDIYFTNETGPTVSSIIQYIDLKADKLIDLRVERPSLEERFLEITQ